jgi:hypothetical protein
MRQQHDKAKEIGLFIRISADESKMIRDLRQNHATNISQLVRNLIREQYEKTKR